MDIGDSLPIFSKYKYDVVFLVSQPMIITAGSDMTPIPLIDYKHDEEAMFVL